MKEIRAIIAAYQQARREGQKLALATVVYVEGSSYRKPGARMLVTEQGEFTGAISGGCLEGDALRKAMLAIMQQKNKLVTYDTSKEEVTLGIQLGCNGIVHILFEFVDSADPENVLERLIQAVEGRRQPARFLTLFSLDADEQQPGTILHAVDGQEPVCRPDWQPVLPKNLWNDLQTAGKTGQSSCKQYRIANKLYWGFMEVIEPAIALILVGAGNDALPVANIADTLGWDITVVDGRKTHANAARFPLVSHILVAGPQEAVSEIHWDERTAVVLMTHNYQFDKGMLALVKGQPCRYIGSLGPKKKLDRMLADLATAGTPISEEEQAKLYGPIGLDIGADSPEEVALAIIAEIKGCMSGKKLPSLKFKDSPIHERFDGNYLLPIEFLDEAETLEQDKRMVVQDPSCAVDIPLNRKA